MLLPIDNIAVDDSSSGAQTLIVSTQEIPDGWEGLDMSPESMVLFKVADAKTKTVVWNGPMGVLEYDLFVVARMPLLTVAHATKTKGSYLLNCIFAGIQCR